MFSAVKKFNKNVTSERLSIRYAGIGTTEWNKRSIKSKIFNQWINKNSHWLKSLDFGESSPGRLAYKMPDVAKIYT